MTLNVITRGYGPGASPSLVITRGYRIGAAASVAVIRDDFTGNLQTAIFTALKAVSPVISGGRIYDAVPVGIDSLDSNFPYIVIGETQVITDDTDTSGGISDDGVICYVTLHVWSRYRGKSEVHSLNTQLYRALHGATLTVTGRASALSWVESMMAMDDPDGVSRHGIVTAKITHRT